MEAITRAGGNGYADITWNDTLWGPIEGARWRAEAGECLWTRFRPIFSGAWDCRFEDDRSARLQVPEAFRRHLGMGSLAVFSDRAEGVPYVAIMPEEVFLHEAADTWEVLMQDDSPAVCEILGERLRCMSLATRAVLDDAGALELGCHAGALEGLDVTRYPPGQDPGGYVLAGAGDHVELWRERDWRDSRAAGACREALAI